MPINDSLSNSYSIGGSLGFNEGPHAYGGGISLDNDDSTTQATLIDVNGDGLPDEVSVSGNNLVVRFNTGDGFGSPVLWPIPQSESGVFGRTRTTDEGGGAYFTFPIPLLYVSLIINPGFNTGWSMSPPDVMLDDINGDGYPDFLSSDSGSAISVAENPIADTNRLKIHRAVSCWLCPLWGWPP